MAVLVILAFAVHQDLLLLREEIRYIKSAASEREASMTPLNHKAPFPNKVFSLFPYRSICQRGLEALLQCSPQTQASGKLHVSSQQLPII